MTASSPNCEASVPAPGRSGSTVRARVVVIGAGFGGLEAARRLGQLPVDVVLIDRHNYHLFTPLLYQVATAGLEPEEIAHPIRGILRGITNVAFLVAEVQSVDLLGHKVHTSARDIPYDYLIVAGGSTNNFFGNDSLESGATGLKDVHEAIALRDRILMQFEAAAWEQDWGRRAAMLTFVIIGGGPTGVEFSGALSELVYHVLPRDYPRLDFGQVRVILVEATNRLLAMLDPKLQRSAVRDLRRKRVEVRLGSPVERLESGRLYFKNGDEISADTVVWAAGVRAGKLTSAIDAKRGRQDRLTVGPTLQLPGHPEVFVIGDMAGFTQDGKPLPMVAQVAIQGAQNAVRGIENLMSGRSVAAFCYHDKGTMATIGRNAAVAQIGRLKFAGFIAWLAWLGLHLVTLIGFRNRVLVLVNWAWDYFFYDRAVRLILGDLREDRRPNPVERANRQ